MNEENRYHHQNKTKMKYLSLLLFITTFISCTYTQNSRTKIDDTYKKKHTFGDCAQPLGFGRNSNTRSWIYPGRHWKFAKVDIESFEEINDSILLNADFNAMFQEVGRNGKPMKNMNVGKGEFVIVKHQSRVHDFYVFKYVNQIDRKVKLDIKEYRIKSKSFEKLDDVDKLKYCLKETDLRTLHELVTQENLDINVCEKFVSSTMTALSLTISDGNKKAFDKLIELGVNIDQPCYGNRTALMRATRSTDTYYFEKLVELGADVNIKDERGKTVHDYIKNKGNFELLELIE